MFKRLAAIFRSPVFEDGERTRIAVLLTPILWLMLGIAAVIGITALLLPQIPDPLLLSAVGLTVGSLLGLQLVERGHVKAAAVSTLVFFWLIITSVSIVFAGLTAFVVINFLILIVFAGLLLGAVGALISAASSFLTIAIIYLTKPIQVLPVSQMTQSSLGVWLLISFHFVIVCILIWYADRAVKMARRLSNQELMVRLKAEGELVEGGRRYRLMIETISEPIFLLDRDLGIQYISPTGEREIGIITKDQQGKNLLEFVHPEDQERVAAMFYDLVANPGIVERTECRVLGRGYQWIWFGVVAVNKLSDPDLQAVVASFNDISRRVHADERNRKQALRNRELAELSKLLAEISQDYEGLLTAVSRQIAEILKCGCSLVILSDDGEWLDYVATYNPDPQIQEVWEQILYNERQRIEEGIMGRVVREGKPVLVPEVDPQEFLETTKPEYREYLKDLVYYTILVLPMRARGQVFGALGLSRQPPGPAFTQVDQEFAQELADRCALAIANARLFIDLQEELIERKQAEWALKRSQETLADAQRIGNLGSYVLNLKTKEMVWSDQLFRICGLEPDEMPVDDEFARAFVYPQDREAVRQNTSKILEQGFMKFEHRILTRQGELRYVTTTAHAIYNEAGDAVSILGTVQDITDRKHVEIDLHQRDAILEAVAIAAQSFVHASDWDVNVWSLLNLLGEKTRAGRSYIYRNDLDNSERSLAVLQYHWINQELVGDLQITIPQVMFLSDPGLENWRETMESGEPFYGNIHHLSDREKKLLLLGNAKSFIHVPVFSGEDWQGFIGFDDPTIERSWSTAEVDALTVAAGLIGAAIKNQRAELARRESERLVRSLGDNLPDGAIYQLITSPQKQARYTYISEGVKSLMDISSQQVLEDATVLYDRIHADDREAFLEKEIVCARARKVFDAHVRVYGFGGTARWCHFRAAPREGDGDEIIWDGVIQDITIQKEAEDAIQALNLELEARVRERTIELQEANQELSAFSYSVSHDLRAPLRAIDGYSSLLQQDYGEQLSLEAGGYLQNIRVATQRMADLIDSLLQFSRLTRLEPQKAQVDLSAIAHRVLVSLQESYPERRVDWSVAPEMNVMADPELIQVVMQNLLDNAWKFTSKVENARIQVGEEVQDDRQVYFVRDNGVGFDMEYMERMFEPFERLHHEDEYPGAGIGLATVKRIVERHGGKIWAQAEVDGGAAFWFWL